MDVRFIMDFNNREIATLIWLGALGVSVFAWRKTRDSAFAVLRALCKRIFLIIFGLAGTYAAACVWLLSSLDLWVWSNLKTTLIWAITVGFVAMFDLNRIDEDRTYFRKTILNTLSFTAVLIFVAQFYSFSLGVELVLLPLLTFAAMMQAVAQNEPEHVVVERFLGKFLALIGICILVYSVFQTIRHWHEVATAQTVREFVLPVLLTFMFLPLLYLLSVYMVYERVFGALSWAIEDKDLRQFAKRRALLRFRLNLDLLKRWRRLLLLERPDCRDDILRSIQEVNAIYKREQSPPKIDPLEGWSPYAAMSFLVDAGIEPGDYHRIYDAWQSSSKFLKLNPKGISNSIVYYVDGTELIATELTLNLMVQQIELSEEADAQFYAVGRLLLDRALGDGASALLSIPLQDFKSDRDGNAVVMQTEEWTNNSFKSYGRTLTIQHRAHKIAIGFPDT